MLEQTRLDQEQLVLVRGQLEGFVQPEECFVHAAVVFEGQHGLEQVLAAVPVDRVGLAAGVPIARGLHHFVDRVALAGFGDFLHRFQAGQDRL